MDRTTSDDLKQSKKAYSVQETMRLLGLSRSAIYAAFRSGILTKIKVGTRTLVPAASIEALVSNTPPWESIGGLNTNSNKN